MLNQSHTPLATHQYTANTHTQLPVLDNQKYPSSQIFGQSQMFNITNITNFMEPISYPSPSNFGQSQIFNKNFFFPTTTSKLTKQSS